ncbi:MAG: 4Fe-4S dicluster domain-containing protein [Planctomycetota bacterium]|nr:MAG: 4Fe-4S dicluster domain-containing protein [Planctomycetota bacterium]
MNNAPPAPPGAGDGVDTTRRALLQRAIAGAGGLAALFGSGSLLTAEIARAEAASVLDGADGPPANHLERMLADLDRALQKPMEQRKWVMVIDLQKCTGCKACTVSCVAENNLPPGVVYRPVIEEEIGEFPNVRRRFIPRPCMQCDNPPCTPVCPVSATYKRPDGIVQIDYDVCIGCRYCIAACPYNARTADFGEYYNADTPEIMDYETRPNFEYGREWKREPGRHASPIGNARKCHFCLHRIENGMLPACVTTCLGGATYFGDYNDNNSLVHELVGSTRVMRLKEELGTEPKVYYLV